MRLSAAEARSRFAGARVARLATVSATGVPHLVPVTFAVLGERIVFVVDDKPKSTTRLRRLDNIAARPTVCLLVDIYDDDWTRLWWARATAPPPSSPPTPRQSTRSRPATLRGSKIRLRALTCGFRRRVRTR
jgi:PPOX class probable F420-dependent enzyme